MIRSSLAHIVAAGILLISAAQLLGQADSAESQAEVQRLVAVLDSEASQNEKTDACRELGRLGSAEAIAPLAALLGDEKLSHMARYGLEPIAGAAVDQALRDALGKLKGRQLAGVITSIGVRRDAKAVEPLGKLLKDADADVVQAAARALGCIGNNEAAQALNDALAGASGANQWAIYEGLFRCAEKLAAKGQRSAAINIYDQARKSSDAPQHVRAGAVCGAILTRQREGLPLFSEYLNCKDYVMFAAACQAAQVMPGDEVTQYLLGHMHELASERQVVVLQTLGKRANPATLSGIIPLAKAGEKAIRLAAVHCMAQIADISAIPALTELSADGDADIAQAARAGLDSLTKGPTSTKPAE